MNPLIKDLMARKQKLETVIGKAEAELKKLPEGKLWVSPVRHTVQYYQVVKLSGVVTRKYLNQKNEKCKNGLAQREYLTRLLKFAKAELKDIDRILEAKHLLRADEIYSHLHPNKKALVIPMLMDDEEFAKWWESRPFEAYDKWPEELKYSTKRGELVRTKSEAMIADAYYDLGIPYRYECPVRLSDGKVRHPDFTLLHKSERKVIYHEHFGMLDDARYRTDNVQKLDLYRRNGIYVGKNLILTFEVAGSPLNIRLFKQNMKEMFGV